jgi:TonB family protein
MKNILTLICVAMLAAGFAVALNAHPATREGMGARAAVVLQASNDPEEAARLNDEVVKLFSGGKFAEALPLAKRVLELREKELGRQHPLVGGALLNLAAIEQKLGKTEDARGLLRRAVAIFEKNGDETVRQLINALDTLNRLETYIPNAIELHKRSLALKEKTYGPDSQQVSLTVFQLAHFDDLLGNDEEAERFFKRFISIREKIKVGAEDDVAVAYMRLGCLLNRKGKRDEAQANQTRAIEIFNSVADKRGPIEGGIVNGKAISKPQPVYPDAAKRSDAQGTIAVQILIGEAGTVLSACAQGDGHPALKRAAEFAAYESRFTPTTVDGKAVKVIGIITYNFVLRR